MAHLTTEGSPLKFRDASLAAKLGGEPMLAGDV